MNQLEVCLEEIQDSEPYRVIISKSSKNVSAGQYKKIEIDKKEQFYQISKYTDKQVFHENIKYSQFKEKCLEYLGSDFLQLNGWTKENEYFILISRKGKVTFKKKKINPCNAPVWNYEHNHKKNYILKEGEIIEPLVDMGIFTEDGKVVNSMYDKYRQINRFIEIIDDEIHNLDSDNLNIIDFGCGKSYLTFILYYYLTQIKKIKTNIIGLDLKADVIDKCNAAAKKYGYDGLRFMLGDINGFTAPFDVDMVITLHACDTATDYALYNAVKWEAKLIFSVPAASMR